MLIPCAKPEMILAIKSNVIACLFFILAKVSLSLDKMKSKIYNLKVVKSRIRFYCAKEDRCQQQVLDKLLDYGVSSSVSEEILLELIVAIIFLVTSRKFWLYALKSYSSASS